MTLTNCTKTLCTFCFKQVCFTKYEDNLEKVETGKKFYKNLQRLVKDKSSCLILSSEAVFCRDCEFLASEFCDIYHQVKCLKLQLQWKLEKMTRVMELAERVPTRFKSLKEHFIELKPSTSLTAQKPMTVDNYDNFTGPEAYEVFKRLREDIKNKCKSKN